MSFGIANRLSKIFKPESGKTVMLAVDHGYFQGPTTGLEDLRKTLAPLASLADCLFITRGMLRNCVENNIQSSICLRVSGGPSILGELSNEDIVVSLEEAIRLNVSGIGMSIFVGAENEDRTIANLGRLINEAEKYGMPVLAITAVGREMARDSRYLGLACRIAAEIGSRIVKTYYCEDFYKVVESCPVPIVMAGGKKIPEKDALEMTENAIKEGAPAIFGTWPFVSDLRTGSMSGGSGEQAILMAACGQMAQFYNLPSGIAAGMTDSKIPDAQSGYEKGYTVSLAGHSGANLIYESAGMHASLLGCCLESYVIDNDMLGAINRTVRGIEVNDETLDLGPIRDVCLDGPGHYLGHEQTLSRMQSDYLYPLVGDRENINNWIEQGSTDVIQRAHLKVKEILKSHFPQNWTEEIDKKIREKFPVRIPRKRMQPRKIS